MRRTLGILMTAVLLLMMTGAAFAAGPDMDVSSGSSPEAGAEQNPPIVLPGGITVREDTELSIVAAADETYEVRGLVAAPAPQAVRAPEFLEMFCVPDGIEGCVQRGGIMLSSREIVGTGDTVRFDRGEVEVSQATVIVTGDVIGSGIMSLAQLVRLAGAVSGAGAPLEGPYLEAADFDGSGKLGLSDLVRESELLSQSMAAARTA